jgi:hypothetical protein
MKALGWTIRVINRESFALSDNDFLNQLTEGADVIINLAGAPVSKKWTPEYKTEILNSRVETTRKITGSINHAVKKPSVYISASAIGIYDSTHIHSETSQALADTYLAEVCRKWEQEALASANSTRLVILRLGVVLGEDGGALKKMHTPFSIGLGGKLGNGNQPVSFIHITDLVDAIIFIINNQQISGVVNAVSPFPSNNTEFTDKLGKVLDQPTWFTVPAFALKLMFGEGAQVLLEGQRVIPEQLMQAGFRYKYPTIQNALVNIYG